MKAHQAEEDLALNLVTITQNRWAGLTIEEIEDKSPIKIEISLECIEAVH